MYRERDGGKERKETLTGKDNKNVRERQVESEEERDE